VTEILKVYSTARSIGFQEGIGDKRILLNTSTSPNALIFGNGLLLAAKTASLLLK